jgi:oligoribonuclease NrnB/cAMP/cGMP phosphodiesterase (DHH superfamily)
VRAVVRADLDGIVSASILKAIGLVDEVAFVKISEIQNGTFTITNQDIVSNLPYHPDAYLWFDHHSSEGNRHPPIPMNYRGAYNLAPSAAGVIYQYFIPFHKELVRFEKLIQDTDIVDSADLTLDEIKNPQGNILLGLLVDARTGFGKHSEYKDDYRRWIESLPDLICSSTIDEILELESTQKWIDIYRSAENAAKKIIKEQAHLDDNVIVADYRGITLPPVNRFVIYSMSPFEDGNISVIISDGMPGLFCDISVGHSIFNRTSMVDVGDICSWYGGGGHRTSAACRPAEDEADQVLEEIIAACKEPLSP